MKRTILASTFSAAAGVACLAPGARAQPFAISWSSVTCGGATTPLAAGPFTVRSSIGDPLAGPGGAAGPYSLGAGFQEGGGGPPPCYANCDGSTSPPILNVNDFVCFQTAFAAALPYANCDHSTLPPILNVNDFICFQAAFAAGCR